MMATCRNGHRVLSNAVICGVCGADVVVNCDNGHSNLAGLRFCETCGLALLGPVASSQADEDTDLLIAPRSLTPIESVSPPVSAQLERLSTSITPTFDTAHTVDRAVGITPTIRREWSTDTGQRDLGRDRPRRKKKVVICVGLLILVVVLGSLAFALLSRHTTHPIHDAAPPKATTTTSISTAPTSTPLGDWSTPVIIDASGQMNSVVCTSPVFCSAVDSSGTILSFDGSTWATLEVTGNPLETVSCASTTFCATVGTGTTGGIVNTFRGMTWSGASSLDPGHLLHSISCPSSTFCVAGAAVNVYTFNGATWSDAQPIDPDNSSGEGIPSMSCPSATFCAAVDAYGNAFTFDGSTWSTAQPIDPGTELTSVSCPSASSCEAVDSSGNAFSFNGSTWSETQAIDPDVELTSVSCPTASLCEAVDASGNAFSFNGSTWSDAQPIDPDVELTSVSCPSDSFCMAVDAQGNVMETQ